MGKRAAILAIAANEREFRASVKDAQAAFHVAVKPYLKVMLAETKKAGDVLIGNPNLGPDLCPNSARYREAREMVTKLNAEFVAATTPQRERYEARCVEIGWTKTVGHSCVEYVPRIV